MLERKERKPQQKQLMCVNYTTMPISSGCPKKYIEKLKHSRTSLIRINLDSESSGYAEIPDN